MNGTVINILQSSPNYFYEQQVSFDESITLKFMILSFDLIILSTLNHAKLPQISLFTLYLESFFTQVKLKVSNQFDFHRMKYDSFIDLVCPQQYVDKRSVQVDSYNHHENKVHKITIKYDFKEHQSLKTIQKTKIRFNIGNFEENQQRSKHIGKFSIQNLTCNLESKKNLRKNQQTQIALINSQVSPSICNHEDQSGSFPVLYMNEYNNLKSQGQAYFSELIQNLEPYNASDTSTKPNHLFICHDMKDGYYEDTRFTDPVENLRKNSYRFNFFWYTSVFNYFSHKTITIPPRHWLQLCKRYQVKCLGTFIVQNGRVDENYFMTNQFALKLVYLAKKYQFDGYLINIENEIKDIEALKKWLGFLTNKIHTQIPGSMISWYDSVTTSGAVEYQNQINQKNKIFYDLTDSFYTNYWWTDQMLKKDLNQAQPNKTIYVGNDVWGRGTYGGGQFYLYKAIDEIQKMNRPNQPNLVPALFAPGYTYQNGGENNNPFLKANEDRLYRGVIFENPEIKEWKSFEQNQKILLNLKNSKEFDGKYHAMNLWQYSNKGKLKITFTYRVNSTFPQNIKTSDYKILMRLQDTLLNQTVLQTKIEKKNVTLIHKQIKKLQIILDTKKITPKTDLEIYVATSMKDIFDDEKILISFYLPNIDWIQQVPVTKLHLNSPYNSFLSIGYGQQFYFKGKPILKNYNFLADYDLPPTLSLNHPFSTDIQHEDSYMGGSSIVLHQSPIKLFLIQLPNYQHSYPQSYFAKIVKKGGDILSFYFLQSSGFSVFLTIIQEKQLENGWTEQTYQISAASMKKMKKKFFKDLQTSLMIEIKQKCLIGQIYLQPKFTETSLVKQKQILEISISQSFRTEAKDEIFVDIDLTEILLKTTLDLKKTHRYLVIIDEQFSSFIYMDKSVSSFKGKLRQIKLKIIPTKSQIRIYGVDDDTHQKVLLQQKDIDLSQLKSFPLSHKINIKNY